MYIVELILRWMHIFGAIILLGGTIFMRLAYVPGLQTLAEDQRRALHPAVRSRWAMWVMIAIAMLLISGIVNTILVAQRYDFPTPVYHSLLGIKFLLALVIFWIASKLIGRSASAERFRERLPFWLNVNLILAILVVAMAGVMKLERDAAPRKAPETVTVQQPNNN